MAFFIVSTVLTVILYSKIFAALFSSFGVRDFAILGNDFRNSTIFALFATVATLFYAFKATASYAFVTQVADELVKVVWPSWDESKEQTQNTVVITAIIGIILFVFDWFFGWFTDALLQVV
jgi:preprotein translocase subunit SecE